MKIILKRDVEVIVYGIMGELYLEEERPVYKNLLEIGKKSSINENNLQSFFSNYSDEIRTIIISRILRYLEEKNLIDSSGNLTKTGKKVIETGKFKVYEKGKYRIWCINDALVGQKILHLQRADNDNYKTHNDFPLKKIVGIEHIDFIEGNKFYFNRFCGDRLNYKIIEGFNSKISLIWEIKINNDDIKSNNYTLKGPISYTKRNNRALTEQHINETLRIDEEIENTLDVTELMYNIFLHEYEWDADKNGILLKFKEIPERTFETFKMDLKFSKREILSFGVFQEIELINVRVIPADLSTSIQWLKKNLQKFCKNEYITPFEFSEFLRNFKKLDEIEYYRDEITLSSELVIKEYQAKNLIDEYWHLQAPIDLNIEEI